MSRGGARVSLDPVPAGPRALLEAAAALAGSRGERLAWVGGGVRDLLLGRAGLDLDLVLEGDLEAFGDALAGQLDGRVTFHPRFLTATIALPGGARLDLVRARAERYAAPAVLPEVAPAALSDDLARRDFSINAIALALAPEPERGGLIDPFDGRGDLAAGRLRALHARSFEDDPTRLLRGLRFVLRFGFGFAAETESWARAAVERGLPGRLSGARLAHELRLLFDDRPEVEAALTALGRFGMATLLSPALGARPTLDAAIERAARARAAGRELAPWLQAGGWRLALAAAAGAIGAAAAAALAARLELSRVERDLALAGPRRVERAVGGLAADLAPHRVAELLSPLSDEELALVAARGPEGADWTRRWLAELRGLRAAVTGADLIAAGVPPGVDLGRALRAARRARLDGLIGPEQELAFALRSVHGEGDPG